MPQGKQHEILAGVWRNKVRLAVAGFWLLLMAGLIWTPFPAADQAFREARLSFPGWPHLAGIDGLGRDFLSRLWVGAGWTLGLGFVIMVLTIVAGGLTVGAAERWPRAGGLAVNVMVPMGLTLPVIFVALLLLAAVGPSLAVLVGAVVIGNWVFAFRQIRTVWHGQIGRPYVTASRVLGAAGWMLFRRTLWPNLVADLLALVRLFWAIGILEISGLAFLGLVGDPDFPELGAILRQNQTFIVQDPVFVIIPGLLLMLILASLRCLTVVKTCNR